MFINLIGGAFLIVLKCASIVHVSVESASTLTTVTPLAVFAHT